MSTKKNRTAIILAGGKSARMGSDKGLLLYKETPFTQHIINAVTPLVDHTIIVSNNSKYDTFGDRVEDLIHDSGPIAGLHSGLTYSTTENNLVISCDAPLITTALMEKLIKYEDETIDCVQFEAAGKTIPLIALYKKKCTSLCEKLLLSGEKRLRTLIKELNTRTIQIPEKEQFMVANINTVEDLKAIKNAIEY